ncbi:MAG: TetR/AcrR family transcriptional regulator [bacterium]|nr:TetR/AcrR family transcriptional regulator [bacterium]
MTKKEDLRVIKTKRNIEDTFLKLLDTTSFEKITVRLILEKALISKGTFYSHYMDKYDLAQKVIDGYLENFRSNISARLKRITSQVSYEVLWEVCKDTIYMLINDMKRLKKIYIEDFDIEISIKKIWKEEYESYIKSVKGDSKNIGLKSSIVAALAMEYMNYIHESGEVIEIYDYIKSVHEISEQYLDCISV